jgi:sugar phosphate isomerase/epimerase
MLQRQLGVQAHCLRFRIAAGLEAALREVRELNLAAIELVSFPGCRGNAWGDFGAATDWPPQKIGHTIHAAGLACPGAMVTPAEIAESRLETTVEWLRSAGIPRLILSSLPGAGTRTMADWRQGFASLNALGERLRGRGLDFAYHTQPDLWRAINGVFPADELLQIIDPALCRIEFDPSGPIIYGTDPAQYIAQRPECFYALHLRDGTQPPAPVFYLAAEVLGTGTIRWDALLGAAGDSAMEWYFLEMEVADAPQTLAALAASLRFLRAQGLVH